MSTAWAVARQMIAEGIRMKIAVVFLLLLAMVVLGLPFSIQGDSSLTGAVQSFLSYALSCTGLLLGILTIFMSRSMSDELVNHQIFLVMSKPVQRWQYVLGKWLGITVLNAAFLSFTGLAILSMVYYIKATHPPIEDRFDAAELVNEVLVARHALQSTPRDFSAIAEQEFQRNLEEGLYQNVPKFDAKQEKARLAAKHAARWRVVEPLGVRVFEFKNVLCDRSPDKTIQIRYKTNVSFYPPDEIYRAWWSFGDPLKGATVYDVRRRDVVNRFHTVRVAADAVAPDHTLRATFYNQNPFLHEPLYRSIIEFRRTDGPELLFVVGSFGWNLARLMTLMMCKLMFLAAVASLMTTVFSFPVACLTSFSVYILAGARSFIAESLEFAANPDAPLFESFKDFFVQSFSFVLTALGWVVPDFAYYDAVEDFVAGRNVALVWVLSAVWELAIVKTLIVLGAAMLLFHRREVAETSV